MNATTDQPQGDLEAQADLFNGAPRGRPPLRTCRIRNAYIVAFVGCCCMAVIAAAIAIPLSLR